MLNWNFALGYITLTIFVFALIREMILTEPED